MTAKQRIAKTVGITPGRLSQLQSENGWTDEDFIVKYCANLREQAGKQGNIKDLANERAALANAQRRKVEQDLAIRERELLEASAVEAEWTQMVLTFRGRMLALPSKLAPLLVNQANPREIQALLDQHVKEALAELVDAGADSPTSPQ